MRVISGKYKGKKLDGFDIEGTRPTMDRVKESMFASIQNYIKDSIVLDLFAGSGSLGIEALSNGAKECVFVDNNKIVYDILKKNTSGIDNSIIIKNDYQEVLKSIDKKFDVIILDPPYSLNLINPAIKLIEEYNLLNINGIIVCEYETEIINDNSFELIKEKKYSSKCLRVYKRVK